MLALLAWAGTAQAQASDGSATGQPASDQQPVRTGPAPVGASSLAAGASGSTSASASDGQDVQAIVITGSRIVRRDYVADSPIVTVGQDYLQAQAGTTFAIKMQQLPQFTPGANELTGSGQPTGQATLDLRGLGANRTLVLADGRRLQPSTSAFVVDLNTIPSALIQNVEVITGGASAIYGSDAIAGVVNLKLRHDFSGVELSSQYNITQHGDGREVSVNGLIGANLPDNRGNVMVAASVLDRGLATFVDRDFYRRAFALGAAPWGSDLLPQGNFIPDGTNLPSQAAVNSVFAKYGVAPGTVAASNALSFNQDATNSVFSQYGGYNYQGPYNDDYVLSPASNSIAFNLGPLQYLDAPTRRYNFFTRGEYDITDSVTAYIQGMFTDSRSDTNYGAGLQTQGTTAVVPSDYAFIPGDLATLLASRPDPDAPFSMHKLWLATGTSVTRYDNSVYQVIAGLKGKIGKGWSWDIYGSHGATKIDVTQVSGGASFSRIQSLITSRSVTDTSTGDLVHVPEFIPSGSGADTMVPNPAYQSATNDGGRSFTAADGSVPCPGGLNLFSSTVSASCAAYLQIHPTNRTVLKQDIVEGTITGPILTLPAGQLQVAVGGNYRRDSYDYSPDPAATDLVGSFPAYPVSGATEVKEGYIEASIPILRDVPFAQSLTTDFAYRYSNYRVAGGVSTYKGSLDWTVTDAIRLRGGYQRAIRAPNVIELYNPEVPAAALLGQGDPCNFDSALRQGANGTQIRALCLAQGVPASIIDSYKSTFAGTQAIQSGNLDLKPEKADTYTAGVVLTPKLMSPMFRKLSLSVDYYRIDLKQAISTISADIVFQRCFNVTGDNPSFDATNSYCQAILRNPSSGTPDSVKTPYFNLGGVRTSGLDIQFDWGFPLSAIGLPDSAGSLGLNVVASRLLSFDVQASPDAPYVSYNGTIDYMGLGNNGAHPHWKTNTTLAYMLGRSALNLRWYYVGPMGDVFGGPGVGSYSRFDLSATTTVAHQIQIGAGVSNLFNVEPLETFGGLPGNTDSGTYDPLGRRFYLSVRVKFQ